MNMNNIDKNDMYYNNAPTNGANTMSFMGLLSPAASSVDSSDAKIDQISLSPSMTMEYNSALHMMENFVTDLEKPYLRIIEEPVEKFRFRYKSEMAGTHGSLIGMSSDKIRKSTYPEVQLENFDGRAIIRCSIYQIRDDVPHAHRLVMKADLGEKDDPHDIEVSPERGYKATFKSMGIIHTAKKYLAAELYKKLHRLALEDLARQRIVRNLTSLEEAELRKQAEDQSKIINLNTVRLKFEAFREVIYDGLKLYQPLCGPVYSQGINNLKSALTGELKIVRLDHTTASCVGGQEIFILVEKVTKNNIKVRFFETDDDDNEIWADYGRFSPNDVHHQYAIVFKVPPYRDLNIQEPVNVCMQLERPTDHARSEPRTFKYKPSEKVGRKRVRYCESVSSGELPTTINSNRVSFGSVDSIPEGILNSDFFNDLANLDSSEFDKLANSLDIENCYKPHLSTDGCASTSTSDYDKRMTQDDVLYMNICKKVVNEVAALVNQNAAAERVESVVEKLFKDLRAPDGNNALHCAILSDQIQNLRYMLLLLSKMRHLNILNIQNEKKQTALHVAVQVNDPAIVKLLISVGVNPNIVDKKGDTPLNFAVKNNYKLEEYVHLVDNSDLELECDGGHTPAQSAIKNNNLKSIKLLVEKKADVNRKIPSTGNTCLHLAILEKNEEIVRFLLEEAGARIDIENHAKVTPVSLAKSMLTEGQESQTIFNIISEYVKNHGFESLIIKEEPDCESDEDSCDEFSDIKMETNSPEPQQPLDIGCSENDMILLKNSQFKKECISELSKILDDTDVLKKLSRDLNFEEIQNSLLTLNTVQILNFANVTEKNVFIVRDFLRSYGAREAVQIIDKHYLNK